MNDQRKSRLSLLLEARHLSKEAQSATYDPSSRQAVAESLRSVPRLMVDTVRTGVRSGARAGANIAGGLSDMALYPVDIALRAAGRPDAASNVSTKFRIDARRLGGSAGGLLGSLGATYVAPFYAPTVVALNAISGRGARRSPTPVPAEPALQGMRQLGQRAMARARGLASADQTLRVTTRVASGATSAPPTPSLKPGVSLPSETTQGPPPARRAAQASQPSPGQSFRVQKGQGYAQLAANINKKFGLKGDKRVTAKSLFNRMGKQYLSAGRGYTFKKDDFAAGQSGSLAGAGGLSQEQVTQRAKARAASLAKMKKPRLVLGKRLPPGMGLRIAKQVPRPAPKPSFAREAVLGAQVSKP